MNMKYNKYVNKITLVSTVVSLSMTPHMCYGTVVPSTNTGNTHNSTTLPPREFPKPSSMACPSPWDGNSPRLSGTRLVVITMNETAKLVLESEILLYLQDNKIDTNCNARQALDEGD